MSVNATPPGLGYFRFLSFISRNGLALYLRNRTIALWTFGPCTHRSYYGVAVLTSPRFRRHFGATNKPFSGNHFSFFAVGGSSPFKRR
jgi:hypothetical protein